MTEKALTPFCPACATVDSEAHGNREVGSRCRTHPRTTLVDLDDPAVIAGLAAADRSRRKRWASQGMGIGVVLSAVVVAYFVLTDGFHPYLLAGVVGLAVAGWCFGFSAARPRYHKWTSGARSAAGTHTPSPATKVHATHWTQIIERRAADAERDRAQRAKPRS